MLKGSIGGASQEDANRALGVGLGSAGFPHIGLQGFEPKLAKVEIASLSGAGEPLICADPPHESAPV